MLENKKIVIIGGTTGIGFSAAQSFLSKGAKLILVGRSEESGHAAKIQLGNNVEIFVGDATEMKTSIAAIELCIENYNGFDGLYHVAGGSGRSLGDGPLHEISLEGWIGTMNLNLTSIMLSNQAAVKQFMKQETGGTILNMGSVLGYSPSPHFFTTHTYAAAKSAIIGFTKSIASYYSGHNIRANVIAPALVETPMSKRAAGDDAILNFIKTKQPLDGGRIGRPSDLDGLATYFMSDKSLFTTGQVVAVDGGWSISDGQY